MYPVNFRKERATYLLDCLATGKPIAPSRQGDWTIDDMMALAGACHFAAMSHGPLLARVQGIDTSKLPEEYQEAHEETLFADLRAAIEFYSHLTMLVNDDQYDEGFEPNMHALVRQTGEVENHVMPVKGHKI